MLRLWAVTAAFRGYFSIRTSLLRYRTLIRYDGAVNLPWKPRKWTEITGWKMGRTNLILQKKSQVIHIIDQENEGRCGHFHTSNNKTCIMRADITWWGVTSWKVKRQGLTRQSCGQRKQNWQKWKPLKMNGVRRYKKCKPSWKRRGVRSDCRSWKGMRFILLRLFVYFLLKRKHSCHDSWLTWLMTHDDDLIWSKNKLNFKAALLFY